MNKQEQKIHDYAKQNNTLTIDELKYFPKYFAIATTSLCNARCSMCVIDKWDKSVPFMEDETFDKLLYEIKPNVEKVKRVTIQLNGEPLLDKKLEERIKKLKNIGVKEVFFSTNGSLMNKKRAKSILESGIDEVDFSIDGTSKETYSQIRHGLDFDEVIKNTREFFKIRNEGNYKTRVSIRMTAQPINEHEVDSLEDFWAPYSIESDRIYSKKMHSWGNELDRDYDGQSKLEELNNLPCIALWGTMTILSNGQVVLCCNDVMEKYVIGNVKEQTIQEIWQGKIINNLRKKHITKGRKSVPMCVGCHVWEE